MSAGRCCPTVCQSCRQPLGVRDQLSTQLANVSFPFQNPHRISFSSRETTRQSTNKWRVPRAVPPNSIWSVTWKQCTWPVLPSPTNHFLSLLLLILLPPIHPLASQNSSFSVYLYFRRVIIQIDMQKWSLVRSIRFCLLDSMHSLSSHLAATMQLSTSAASHGKVRTLCPLSPVLRGSRSPRSPPIPLCCSTPNLATHLFPYCFYLRIAMCEWLFWFVRILECWFEWSYSEKILKTTRHLKGGLSTNSPVGSARRWFMFIRFRETLTSSEGKILNSKDHCHCQTQLYLPFLPVWPDDFIVRFLNPCHFCHRSRFLLCI